MEDNLNTVDAVQENAVDSQNIENTEPVEQVESVNEEVATSQPEKPVQSAEENSKWAEMRRKTEAEAQDKLIKKLSNGQFNTYSEYEQALAKEQSREEAIQKGIDPEIYSKFQEMESKLNRYEQEKTFIEQDSQLSKDPVKGQFYNEWKDEVRDVSNTYGVDLKTAFTLLLDQKLPEILSKTQNQIQNETIKKINQNSQSTPGTLSTEPINTKVSYKDMSKSDFDKKLNEVLYGGGN